MQNDKLNYLYIFSAFVIKFIASLLILLFYKIINYKKNRKF